MAHPSEKISVGFRRTFFQRVIVTSSTFGDASGYANVLIPIRSTRLSVKITNEGASSVDISYGGYEKDAEVKAASSSTYENINKLKIWFKCPSGATSIMVEAWAT